MPSNAAILVLGFTQSTFAYGAAWVLVHISTKTTTARNGKEGQTSKNDERVKINVDGTTFGTIVSTLTRLENTVLDYLRDEDNFVLPTDRDARESLRREAEFYLPGLAKMRSPRLRTGDGVLWKDSNVEANLKFFARYEYNGKKTCVDNNCLDCGGNTRILATHSNTINYEEWRHVKLEVLSMKGIVVEVKSRKCCAVKWDNGWEFQHPQCNQRLATSE